MGKIVRRIIKEGTLPGILILIVPAFTLAIFIWMVTKVGLILSIPIRPILGNYYRPGLEWAVGFAAITTLGFFARSFVVKKLFSWVNLLLTKPPIIKSIYGIVKNIFNLILGFSGEKEEATGKAALIRLADGTYRLGIVTVERLPDFFSKIAGEGSGVLVFWACQIGGELKLVPKDMITLLPELSAEQVLKFNLTGGAVSPDAKSEESRQ